MRLFFLLLLPCYCVLSGSPPQEARGAEEGVIGLCPMPPLAFGATPVARRSSSFRPQSPHNKTTGSSHSNTHFVPDRVMLTDAGLGDQRGRRTREPARPDTPPRPGAAASTGLLLAVSVVVTQSRCTAAPLPDRNCSSLNEP